MSGWIAIAVLGWVTLTMAMDLFVLDRPGRAPSVQGALSRTAIAVAAAIAASVGIVYLAPADTAERAVREFLAAWLLEFSLSLDNLFVFALILAVLAVPPDAARRVLVAGLPLAIALRAGMIFGGLELLGRWPWLSYAMGVLLLLSALRMLVTREPETDPSRNFVVRFARRLYPVSAGFDGRRFITRVGTRRAATPLALALIMIASADFILSFDSVPALFTVTRDPVLAFAASALALSALCGLYFALGVLEARTRLIKLALAFLLVYLSIKMFIFHRHPIPVEITLAVIAIHLGAAVIGTIVLAHRLRVRTPGQREPSEPVLGEDVDRIARAALGRARKLIALVVGLSIVGLSIPIGMLPGPGGIAVFIIGMAILASEFIWARRLMARVRDQASHVAARADSLLTARPRPWLIPPVIGLTLAAVALVIWLTPLPPRAVIFASLGPLTLEIIWAYRTLERWRRLRRDRDARAL
jgi:tellurite resistance protein TerC